MYLVCECVVRDRCSQWRLWGKYPHNAVACGDFLQKGVASIRIIFTGVSFSQTKIPPFRTFAVEYGAARVGTGTVICQDTCFLLFT
jgi:hypothetical protein